MPNSKYQTIQLGQSIKYELWNEQFIHAYNTFHPQYDTDIISRLRYQIYFSIMDSTINIDYFRNES